MKNYKKQGLTLIEALIWFAIFAAVVTGVFTLYSNSRNSNNSATINKELSTIFSQTESLYNNASTDGLTNLVAIQMGIFPSSLKITDLSNGTVKNVFGGDVSIVSDPPSGFRVNYNKIPKGSICSNIVRSQRSVGWYTANNGTTVISYTTAYNMTQVANFCGTDGSGTVDIRFSRHNSSDYQTF